MGKPGPVIQLGLDNLCSQVSPTHLMLEVKLGTCLVSMDNPAGNEDLCELVRELLSAGAYEPWIQVFFYASLDFFLVCRT